jgi:thioredoxin 1
MIAPHLEELAKESEGKLKIAKLNVDDAPDVATRYTVMSIPTLLVFRDGKVMGKKVGVMSKRDLAKFIQPYL